MSVIQISKIQVRRGLEQDFTPSTNVGPGEFVFAENTGRLFIGADDTMLGPWPSRNTEAPYGNIEVLTEASLQTFARMFDRLNRSIGNIDSISGMTPFARHPYFEADLPITATSLPVMVKTISETTGMLDDLNTDELVLANLTNSCGAILEYFVSDLSGNVIRTGSLMIVHNGNVTFPAHVSDEYVAWPSVTADGDPMLVSDVIDINLQFSATVQNNGDSTYRIRLEYINNTESDLVVHIRGASNANLNL